MLSPQKKRGSLTGKLLLSSALVTVSLAYGWWQRSDAGRPVTAMMSASLPPMSAKPAPAFDGPAPAAPDAHPAISEADAASGVANNPNSVADSPASQKPVAVAKAAPEAAKPAPADAPLQQNSVSPAVSSLQPVTPQPLPTPLSADGASPPVFLITGTPDPEAKAPVPAGGHLEDGDYVSDKHQLMWGDLRVKIFVRGGQITGVQTLEYPDHRSQSLYLSQLAIPALESEVIKNQKSQVDTVSSATDTSYTFQDAVANAIIKATRG
jgi:uncharacterized protein with FMN-binding domain